MITEDYVSFEIAKLLKEKGFDEATHQFYKAITYLGTEANSICIKSLDGIEDEPFHNSVYGVDLNGEDSGEYACPTLQMTMKWLREVHNIHIELNPICTGDSDEDLEWHYGWAVRTTIFTDRWKRHNAEHIPYEQACEAAIRYSIENLI